MNQLKKGIINLSPKFQRRNAWNVEKKSKLIESIILGLPIPEIILAESKEKKGAYLVIDGKQRLLSLREFCSTGEDDFAPFKLKKLKILDILNGKTFEDLSTDLNLEDYLNAFENQTIRTVVIKNWPSDNFLYTVFHRLNTGSVQLSPQELRQAIFPGLFLDYVDDYSQKDKTLSKILKIEKPDGRMRDVELLIRYFAFKNYLSKYKGNLKKFLDFACDDLNNLWNINNELIIRQAEDLISL